MAVTDLASPRPRFSANPWLVDATIALGLAALSLLALGGGAPTAGEREPLAVALVLLESLPLIARRRFPVAVLAVTFGATFGHVLLAPQGASVSEGIRLARRAVHRGRAARPKRLGAGRRLDGRHVRRP